MNALLGFELGAYLQQAAGLKVELESIATEGIPFFLRGRYDVAEGQLYGRAHVFFAPKPEFDDWTPSVIQSDRRRLENIFGRVPVFVSKGVEPNQRQRLIQLRIPFIVPNRQMYLPELLIDLREHFTGQRAKPIKVLSPSAQQIFLMALERRIDGFENARVLSGRAHFTAMTAGRAMDELEAVKLARVSRHGKIKSLHFGMGDGPIDWRDLWNRAAPRLQPPVRRSLPLLNCPPDLLRSAHLGGLSALARYSALNEPRTNTLAIGPEWYRNHTVAFEGAECPSDIATETLELWTYDPGLSSNEPSSWIRGAHPERGGMVDRLSLFLALHNDTDERVRQAVEEMMEDIKW